MSVLVIAEIMKVNEIIEREGGGEREIEEEMVLGQNRNN